MVSLTTLRSSLAERGIHYPSGGKHLSKIRLWLAKAGVYVGDRWQVDDRLQMRLLHSPQAYNTDAD